MNIFAPGYSLFRWSIRDTVAARGVGGRLRVREKTSRQPVAELTVGPDGNASVPLLSGYDYQVEFHPDGYPDVVFPVAGFAPEMTFDRQISFGVPPPPPPPPPVKREIRLEGINIPLFVSGYYRLNTPELLEDLRRRQREGDLKNRTYIANLSDDPAAFAEYRRMATRVEAILKEFKARTVETDFPAFAQARDPEESLEIIVSGYADPRPILGVYAEQPVTFQDQAGRDVTVRPGDSLDNFRLAGLRAFYAAQYLDSLLRDASSRGSRDYLALVDRGLVRWRAVSGNVDDITRGDNLAERRRIRVEFLRKK